MLYFFYIVRCSDNTLYCGITTDLQRRIEEHNSKTGKSAKYTRIRTPVKLIYHEEHISRSVALKREYEVKQWTKTRKERLVNGIK